MTAKPPAYDLRLEIEILPQGGFSLVLELLRYGVIDISELRQFRTGKELEAYLAGFYRGNLQELEHRRRTSL